MSITTTHLIVPSATAAKKLKRRNHKIVTAFRNIPAVPTDFEKFTTQYSVSPKVMRQIRRHDSFIEHGKVFLRKNKETKRMEIWRDATVSVCYNK